MSASLLLARITRAGGRVWLDEAGRLNADAVSQEQMEALSESYDLVVAWLREQIGSKRWEASGNNPRWWRAPEEAWTPEQKVEALPELIRLWTGENCVGSTRCCTRTSALHRAFIEWFGLGPDVVSEQDFLEYLKPLGWQAVGDWIDNICLTEDFLVALRTLDGGSNCPEHTDELEPLPEPESVEEPDLASKGL